MADNETPQIVTPDSPLPDQAVSAFRSIVLAATAFALGRHWIEGDLATLIGTAVGIVAPVVYGQMKTRHRAKQLIAVGNNPRVPDSVVTTASKAAG